MSEPAADALHTPPRANQTVPRRNKWLRTFVWLVLALTVLFAAIAGFLWHVYETRLKPAADEWQLTWHAGPFHIPLGVTRSIELASDPAYGRWLKWLPFTLHRNTRYGTVQFHWDDSSESLVIQCLSCQINLEGVADEPLKIESGNVLSHLNPDGTLSGYLRLSVEEQSLELPWQAQLTPDSVTVAIQANKLPIEKIYRVLAPGIPELKQAHITGSIGLDATITLPDMTLRLSNPEVNNFTVSGLGTERLLGAQSNCGPASTLPMNSWQVRAVMAAEDQRFEQHPGYDLQELMAAHDANQLRGFVVRGGSTITQQAAKLMFTGSARTFTRKLRELLYAMEMEQTLGKARIMQLYLDNAPWGIYPNGKIICGIESAAQYYFHRSASKLTREQSVWLAAMLHSPVNEARAWQRTGRINLRRAEYVAEYVRGAPNSGPRARQHVIQTLRQNPGLGMTPQPAPSSP